MQFALACVALLRSWWCCQNRTIWERNSISSVPLSCFQGAIEFEVPELDKISKHENFILVILLWWVAVVPFIPPEEGSDASLWKWKTNPRRQSIMRHYESPKITSTPSRSIEIRQSTVINASCKWTLRRLSIVIHMDPLGRMLNHLFSLDLIREYLSQNTKRKSENLTGRKSFKWFVTKGNSTAHKDIN